MYEIAALILQRQQWEHRSSEKNTSAGRQLWLLEHVVLGLPASVEIPTCKYVSERISKARLKSTDQSEPEWSVYAKNACVIQWL